jgi:hypothetical protein
LNDQVAKAVDERPRPSITEAERDLLRRFEALYGLDMLRSMVASGEAARRLREEASDPPDEIRVRIRLRDARAIRYAVDHWKSVR